MSKSIDRNSSKVKVKKYEKPVVSVRKVKLDDPRVQQWCNSSGTMARCN